MGIKWTRSGFWPAFVAVVAMFLAGQPGHAAEYVVDGFALGRPIAPGDDNYASYECGPSADYDGAIACTRSQQRKGQAGQLTISSTLVHAQDGPAWLGAVHVAPVKLSLKALEKEIDDLTRVIGEAPSSVNWTPGYTPDRTAVVATWGKVELEAVYGATPEDISRAGGYLDLFGDPAASLKEYLPVFRLKGGAGYVYAANFNTDGIGDRYYVAVDAEALAPAHYRASLRSLLARDATLAPDDFSLWPKVAMATRQLTLATSSAVANQQFDAVASEFPASKLRSHVWASLPSGAIERLQQGSFWINYDVYGPGTEYPAIREELQRLIATEPNDNFVEFAHLILGDFEGGLEARPDSTIKGVFHYALGIESLRNLLHDALVSYREQAPADLSEDNRNSLEYLTAAHPDDPGGEFSLGSALSFATRYPGVEPGSLAAAMPDFAERAEEVKTHLANVTDTMSVSDDAAFIGAWLDRETGDLEGALDFSSKGLAIGAAHPDIDGTGGSADWLDYQGALRTQTSRIVAQLPHAEVVRTLLADRVLSKEGFLWYSTARDAYRAFDYEYAIELAEAGLGSLGLSTDQLPATTDPRKIRDAIERMDPQLLADLNIVELPYLLEASRELESYEKALVNAAGATDGTEFSQRARQLISKYSMLISRPDTGEPAGDEPPRHQDLRQAMHLIDTTFEQTAGNPAYAPLREWLAFRKVRVLTVYDPGRVRSAVAQLAADFPNSGDIDDALAEQVFVEGMLNQDTAAAWQALQDLVQRAAPGSNAIDNGYSWMQISLRCAGQDPEADWVNTEIIRLFPASRHAQFALGRAANPGRDLRGCDGGYLD